MSIIIIMLWCQNIMGWWPHSQKKQLTPLYIFISVSFELSLCSWIAGLDDDTQGSELFLLRVLKVLVVVTPNKGSGCSACKCVVDQITRQS